MTRPPTQLERRLGRWADRLVAVTRHAHTLYQRAWPAERLEVIYDGVPLNGLGIDGVPALRQDLGLPAAAPVVALLARCVPGKGYDAFLRAAALVRQREPSARFLIVGNGPGGDQAHEAAMRRLAEELGAQSVVVWGGWRNDTARIFALASVVVQASSTFPEGLSRVLLEAMAHGRPVVATSLPTTCEAIEHGETGLLAPPGDAHALAEAILTILNDRTLAERLGRQGCARVAQRFSPAAHAAAIMRMYDTVLSEE